MIPMISPEVQRIALLVALAITGYLMILAWNQDYMQAPPAAERATAPELDGAALSGPAPAADPASDIPDASFIGAPDPTAEPAATPVRDDAADRLVRVTTPSPGSLDRPPRRRHPPSAPAPLSGQP